MQHLTHFGPLADSYDAFVIDLWGVIHDGVTPYAGAVDCLARLEAAGKRVVLLSNAPRRAALAREGMRGMGIADALTTRIVTSGEVTWQMLAERTDPFFAALGRKVYFLAPPHERGLLAGLDVIRVDTPEQAEFVLVAGPDPSAQRHRPRGVGNRAGEVFVVTDCRWSAPTQTSRSSGMGDV